MNEHILILKGYIDHLEYMNKFAYGFFDREQANKDIEAFKAAIKALGQELLCDRLAREYISKVKCCDECFASTFCTINGLRNSRVPQIYCIDNIKKYFESKSEG